MPDPNVWGWIAAGAVGSAFLYLLKWTLSHLQGDIDHSRKSAQRGTELAERAVTEKQA